MKSKNLIIAGSVIVILVAAYIWFFVYNKAHVDYQSEKAAYTGTAIDWYEMAAADAEGFSQKYINKAIELDGGVFEIEGSLVILAPGILCKVDETATNSFQAAVGDEVIVKGRFVGLDEDLLSGDMVINLDQCIISLKDQ